MHQYATFLGGQVYVCVGDQEWNVYRRYTHFHDLHKQVRHVFPDAELALPAKSSLSRKSEKFVEQRRAALEAYMRCGCFHFTPFLLCFHRFYFFIIALN